MTSLDRQNVDKEKNKKKKKWWFLLFFFLLAAVIGGALYYYLNQEEPAKKATVVSGSFLPDEKDASEMTDKEIADYAQKEVKDSEFQMIIGSTITVDSNNNSSDIYIQNPPTNAYPIAVTITLDDGQTIYTSGAIKVGYEVKNATLDTHLDKGSYTGKALFKLYDAKTSQAKGQVAATVNVVVQ